jgi:hypothetical protein
MKYKYIQNSKSNTQLDPQVNEKIIAELKKRRIYSNISEFSSEKELAEILSSINKSSSNTLILIGDDVDFDIFIGQINKIDAEIAIGYIPVTKTRTSSKTNIHTWQNGIEAMAQRKITEKTIYSVSSRFFFDEIILNFKTENLDSLSKIHIRADNTLELSIPTSEVKFENLNDDQFLSKNPVQITAYHKGEAPEKPQKNKLFTEILETIKKTATKKRPESLILSLHSKNFSLLYEGGITDTVNRKYKSNLSIGRSSRVIRLITRKGQQSKDQS